MIQISFEIDALARALLVTLRGGSWEHWCNQCDHPSHYFGECLHANCCQCDCKADGGDDYSKSGQIPWEKLPDGEEYEYGGQKVLNIKGKDYWRGKAEKLLAEM